MGRPTKPPRLERRGSSWYIVDRGQKIACNTRDEREASAALAEYTAGVAAAARRARDTAPESAERVRADHLLNAYEKVRLQSLRKKANKRTYAECRIRLLKNGVDEGEAHRQADLAAQRAEENITDIGNDRYVLRQLRAYFGAMRPGQISQQVVDQYAEQRRATGVSRRSTGTTIRRVADATIEKELVILRAALRWAEKDDRARWLCGAQAPAFSMPVSGANTRVRWLTKVEASKLVAACHLPHIRLLIRIALATGARKAAIEDLRWEQIDWDRNLLDFGHVGPDNKKKRPCIQMPPELRRELWNAKQVACSDHVIEFRGRKAGNTKKSIRAAIVKAGLKSVNPTEDVVGHVLKHTFVSWMLQAGKTHREIALIVNTTAATLERTYAHVDLTAAADVASAVALDAHLQQLDWHPTATAVSPEIESSSTPLS